MLRGVKIKYVLITFMGSAILAFGLYNIHSFSDITEGGVLGLILFLHHWFNISPAISGFIINLICYLFGWRVMGGGFIGYSMVSNAGFSLAYYICEKIGPLWPGIGAYPFLAAVAGAVFVGVGVGLCVRIGGAPGGDDAVAMSVSKLTGWDIRWVYLMSDAAILLLSLSYIPFKRIAWSLLTVVLSGQIIGVIQNFHSKKRKTESRR